MSVMGMFRQLSSCPIVLRANGFKLLLHLPLRLFPRKSLLIG
jgi:hypothetical protein